MSASEDIARIIKDHGGVLKRQNKHEFWKFPNGEIFTRSCTPSDVNGEKNALRDLKRILSLNGVRGIPGERRPQKAVKATTSRPSKYTPTINGALAEKLALAGLAEAAHRNEVDSLLGKISGLQRQHSLKDRKIRRMKSSLKTFRNLRAVRISKWLRGLKFRLRKFYRVIRVKPIPGGAA